jgi:hypothetical protein
VIPITIPRIATIIPRVAIAIPGVAIAIPSAFRTLAMPRRPRAVGAVSRWPITTRCIGSFFGTLSRGIRLPVSEFSVLETSGRAGIAALTRCVRALFAAATVAGTLIPLETRRPIAKRPIAARARRVTIIAARCIGVPAGRRAFALAGVVFARARIRLLAIGLRAIGLAGMGALFAIAFARKAALGEFLLGPAGGAGAPLAAEGTIVPAAGMVVFVVIAGHERSFGCR